MKMLTSIVRVDYKHLKLISFYYKKVFANYINKLELNLNILIRKISDLR